MKHPLIAAKIAREPWSLKPEVFAAICDAVFHDGPRMPAAMEPGEISSTGCNTDEDDDIGGNIAIVPVFGVMGKHLSGLEMACGGCSVDLISRRLKVAAYDDNVSRIVLQIHSPGGMVMGTPELHAQIAKIAETKPVHAYSDGLCCSAALWIATAATTFHVSPSSGIGSVGAYSLFEDWSRNLDAEGVTVNAIHSGKFKLSGAWFREMTDEERAMFQAEVDALGVKFRALVSARWPDLPASAQQGQTFSGEEWTAMGASDGLANDLDELLEVLSGGEDDEHRAAARAANSLRPREQAAREVQFKRNEKGEITGIVD